MKLHLALAILMAAPSAALAQEATRNEPPPAPTPGPRTAPVVNGHTFLPSLLVDTPFRETTAKLGLLYGVGTATGNKYDINGNVVGTADYTFAALGQIFRYEYRFAEWFSASAALTTSLYTGIDGPSVISVGAQVNVGAAVRVKAGHRFGPVETAVVVDVGQTPAFGLLVANVLITAVKNGRIEAGQALQAKHNRTINPALAASWAPWSAFGLTANVGYVYNALSVSGESDTLDQNGIQVAGVGDFDFAKISSVPIGLTAGYRLTTPLGDNGVDRIDDVEGGIFYTGRRDMALGAEIGWRSFEIRPPLNSNGVVVQLQLQYYW